MTIKSRGGTKSAKPQGPNSDSQVLKTWPMDEILGVEAMILGFHDGTFDS